jgi:hypothetical protein
MPVKPSFVLLKSILPKSRSTNVQLYQITVCSKMIFYQIPFSQSPVLPKSRFSEMYSTKFCSTRVHSNKVRICLNVFYQSPVCLKRVILPNYIVQSPLPCERQEMLHSWQLNSTPPWSTNIIRFIKLPYRVNNLINQNCPP